MAWVSSIVQRGGVTKRNRGCSSLHATCDGVVLGGARVVELDRPTLPRHAAQRGQSRPQRALHNGVCRAGWPESPRRGAVAGKA